MIKNASLIIACFMILAFYDLPGSAAAPGVLEYYNLCPSKLLPTGKRSFKKYAESGQWITGVDMEGADIDLQNGYIEYGSRGGGIQRIQFVLYMKKDKTPVIGISYFFTDGVDIEVKSSLAFYEIRDGKFVEITKDVVPALEPGPFLTKKFDMARLDGIKSVRVRDYLIYKCTLPKKGTTAVMQLYTGKLFRHIEMNGAGMPAAEKKTCEEFLRLAEYDAGIELLWNGSRFTAGKKTRVNY
ncbi:MAG: hypothetical protein MUD12_12180 [Spirochaetes bacterium]|jgi:hypothetical protein|nr:hypothetical protein [Spirochaetota bacterium]